MIYKKADEYHTHYIMNTETDDGNPMLAIGMNYIRFAIKETNLFRFLFQSNEFSGVSMLDLLETEELLPLLTVLQNELDISNGGDYPKVYFLAKIPACIYEH